MFLSIFGEYILHTYGEGSYKMLLSENRIFKLKANYITWDKNNTWYKHRLSNTSPKNILLSFSALNFLLSFLYQNPELFKSQVEPIEIAYNTRKLFGVLSPLKSSMKKLPNNYSQPKIQLIRFAIELSYAKSSQKKLFLAFCCGGALISSCLINAGIITKIIYFKTLACICADNDEVLLERV